MFDWVVHLPISGAEVNGFALIILGFTVGVIGGFFGVGGAFMVTPALNVFGFPMAYAIGTDMAHIAGKSIVATVKHRRFGNVDMKLGMLMIVGTVIGIELGATLIMWLEKIGRIGPVVRITYVVLLFGLGFYMWYEYIVTSRRLMDKAAKSEPERQRSRLAERMQRVQLPPMVHLQVSGFSISLWAIIGVGMFTGFLAGFLGVGGGFIRMPALMYLIGSPTKVAVGTDLFEVMFSGAYGAFSYAMKARVELIAALIMLIGAAIGAQIGATATVYARGTIIRLYFAITMLLAGISVIFKHFAEGNKDIYRGALNQWARATSGLSDKTEIGQWLFSHKNEVKAWLLQQPEALQQAQAAEKMWSSLSGYLMLGAACGLSAVIIFWLVRGALRERSEAREAREEAPALPLQVTGRRMVIAASCTPNDLPAVRMGAQIAAGSNAEVDLLVCEEAGVCEASIQEGRSLLELNNVPAKVVFRTGKPSRAILEHAASAGLLVIGSRPLSALSPKYHLGDNATRIVRGMRTSTLVVRGRDTVRRILLCLDMPQTGTVTAMAREVALATGAEIELLYVVALPTAYAPALSTSLAARFPEREAVLQRIRDELIAAGVRRVDVKLREGIVEEEIINESVASNIDLIVLKEGYFKTPFGLLLGRLSTNVATHSPQASVLIVKR